MNQQVAIGIIGEFDPDLRYRLAAKVQDIDDPNLRVKRVTTSMTQY